MGFLKSFFEDVFEQVETPVVASPPISSFAELTDQEIEQHLQISRYGDFELTDAVRPAYNLEVVPTAGYRHDIYRDEQNRTEIPVIMASVSQQRVLDIFMELVETLGQTVDVILETSHGHHAGHHTDLYREHIDMPILQSILWDFEDLLINDGCTGIAVLNPKRPQEVQLDEHKLIISYGTELGEYEQILDSHRIPCSENMRFITEAEHIHSSNERFLSQFEELKMRLGIDEG